MRRILRTELQGPANLELIRVSGTKGVSIPMHQSRIWLVSVSALTALLLCSCSPPSSDRSSPEPKAATSEQQAVAAKAALIDVDTSLEATGPIVAELISIEDFKEVLGRDDIFLAPAS